MRVTIIKLQFTCLGWETLCTCCNRLESLLIALTACCTPPPPRPPQGANAAFFPNSPIPSLSPSPPVPAALPSPIVGQVCSPYAGYHWMPGVYYQPIARYRHDKSDRLEVCRDYIRGTCVRSPEECRFAHPGELQERDAYTHT